MNEELHLSILHILGRGKEGNFLAFPIKECISENSCQQGAIEVS